MAKTLAEITKIDPSFNKDNFLHECEYEIIPSVLQVSAFRISSLVSAYMEISYSVETNSLLA